MYKIKNVIFISFNITFMVIDRISKLDTYFLQYQNVKVLQLSIFTVAIGSTSTHKLQLNRIIFHAFLSFYGAFLHNCIFCGFPAVNQKVSPIIILSWTHESFRSIHMKQKDRVQCIGPKIWFKHILLFQFYNHHTSNKQIHTVHA